LLTQMPDSMHVVFVSRWLAETALTDLQVTLSPDRYSIIPNPIDTELFVYKPKDPELRKRVLSIRPYSNPLYANDVLVKALLLLSKRPVFADMRFHIIGDGPLFADTVKPLRAFKNVILEQRFVPQPEIAELHRQYGVFLCPSRMDTQGVSRDEAMASGLVPVTTAIAAIPEFVDHTCGMLAPPEDPASLAAALERLYHDPELFVSLSHEAATRIRQTRAASVIIPRELQLWSEAARISDRPS
ncbi:MAG: glycosyltransferase family 4 protein, partial [Rectinema sp.]|nr:glycosyltransferase family 4 protein [Rectinema sp.]